MKFKGIIFDLDGTLVNSLEDISDAMNIVLEAHHFPTHTYEVYQYFIGSGLRNLVSKALPDSHNNDTQIEKCYTLMIDAYQKICTQKTKPYEGIFELLAELHSRNIKMSVFSNKADELTKEITVTIFPEYFDPILGLTTEALKKPNPSKAITIASSWGFKPEEIIFVGDSDIDMQTATNANMFAVGVNWGYRTEEELHQQGAKIILKHPTDLLELV